MNNGSNDTPFFILGAARSGTTMLRLMLNRHSRLAIPFESHFLLTIFPEFPIDKSLDRHDALRMAHLVTTERNFPTWHLDPRRVRRMLIRRAPAPLSVLVDALFRMETASTGKPRWGDKTPPYYAVWRQLSELFSDSKLLHIIRDGRDVSLSLKDVGWYGPTTEQRASYWRERVRMAHEAANTLGPKRNLIIRYEDLVLDTRATLERVCDFLGESFEPAMLDFFVDARRHVCDIDGDIHGKLQRPPQPGDVARWRREMTPDTLRQFESLAGDSLRVMSYPLSGDES